MVYIRPVSWSIDTPSVSPGKPNLSLLPFIQIFGYTSDGKTIYVRIPRESTFILKFNTIIDENIISNITDILDPLSIRKSDIDLNTIIVRAPELSPLDFTKDIATWIDVKQDPYGEIESFWEAQDIRPYDWIYIDRYKPIPGKYTSCELNIATGESNVLPVSDIHSTNFNLRLFYWDIETYSSKLGEFPDASNPDDVIFMISVITVSGDDVNSYIITTTNVTKQKDYQIIRAENEKDLLVKFFSLFQSFKPDKQIYYNGDMFDIPYLINRLRFLDMTLPKITKILSYVPQIITRSYPTPFGRELKPSFKLFDTETIDMLHYYRRFFPHFHNHRLDTISNLYLEQGKYKLTIDDMMSAVKTQNSSLLNEVAMYSYVDSLRLKQLWDHGSLQEHIDDICNNLRISSDKLLRESFDNILDLIAYNIDPACSLMVGTKSMPTHTKDATVGIYKNIYVYDYSQLYVTLMKESSQKLSQIMGERLEGSPPQLILSAFYSKYIDRQDLSLKVKSYLNSAINGGMVISIGPTLIKSVGEINLEWLQLTQIISTYVVLGQSNYIVLDNNGIQTIGFAPICRPKFQLAKDVIEQYLKSLYSDDPFIIPNPSESPLDKLVMIEKVGNNINVCPHDIKYILASQYTNIIDSVVFLKYLMTENGPCLLSLCNDTATVDNAYYISLINTYLTQLQSLKVYGC